MAAPRKRKPANPGASLANRARADNRLFLPMEAAMADAAATRYRIAFNQAAAGRGGLADIRALSQAVMMAGLIADIEPGALDDAVLRACEAFFAERLLSPSDAWALSGESLDAALAVLNEHDRQLRQCRFRFIVIATERFERIALGAPSADRMFEIRCAENARKINHPSPL